MSDETIAPVTVLGVVCAHRGDSYGTRTWAGESAAGLTMHLTRDSRGYSLSAFRGVDLLAHGHGATIEVAEEVCERRAMDRQALLAQIRRAT